MDVDAFLLFVAIGLCAQLVDGALGMAYGVISNTALLALGLPPAMASSAVHTAEVVTSGISGGSHALFGNAWPYPARSAASAAACCWGRCRRTSSSRWY